MRFLVLFWIIYEGYHKWFLDKREFWLLGLLEYSPTQDILSTMQLLLV